MLNIAYYTCVNRRSFKRPTQHLAHKYFRANKYLCASRQLHARGTKTPKYTLPYSSVVTASAYTSCMRTLLLYNPSILAWHFTLLNAAYALYILLSNIVLGLFFVLSITSPKYLNSDTFSISLPLHLKMTSILICMAFVFFTFIYRPFN
jgi:hypothetical protein